MNCAICEKELNAEEDIHFQEDIIVCSDCFDEAKYEGGLE